VTANNLPTFPNAGYYTFNAGPADNANLNNILWGDYFCVDTALDGFTQGVFLTADQTGPAGETPCYTGINGAVPDDPCTTGNPLLNAAGLGADTYTFYGRYPSGAQSMAREPLASTFSGRYYAQYDQHQGEAAQGGTDLRLREGAPGPVICQFLSVPVDFEYQCALTAGQTGLLHAGGLFVELTTGTQVRTSRMIPADLFLFADGFESGDVSAWSGSVQ
jgi:hypothetical protein